MHVWDSFIRSRQEGEVESSIVLEIANDPRALAGDLDGDGTIGEASVLQIRPRIVESDAFASESGLGAKCGRSLANLTVTKFYDNSSKKLDSFSIKEY